MSPEVKQTCAVLKIRQICAHASKDTIVSDASTKCIQSQPFSVCVCVCVHCSIVLVHNRDTWCLSVSPRVHFWRSICPGCHIPRLVEPSGPQACHHIIGSAGTHQWAPPPAAGGGRATEGEERSRWAGGSAGFLKWGGRMKWFLLGQSQQWGEGGSCACVCVCVCVVVCV